jgi:hypothetical protein
LGVGENCVEESDGFMLCTSEAPFTEVPPVPASVAPTTIP